MGCVKLTRKERYDRWMEKHDKEVDLIIFAAACNVWFWTGLILVQALLG